MFFEKWFLLRKFWSFGAWEMFVKHLLSCMIASVCEDSGKTSCSGFKTNHQCQYHCKNMYFQLDSTYLSSLKVKTYLSPSNLSFSIGNRKRQRLEDFEKSKTVDKLLDLVGRGHMSVTAACEVAGGVAEDHALPHAAVRAFASLGSEQKHPQNNERDLHRWVKNLYGLQLQPYKVFLDLQMDSLKKRRVPMTVLLPHEVIHAIANMDSSLVFESLFLGNIDDSSREAFWKHVRGLPPWANHPILRSANLKRLIGITIHGDGAVMKRDDECFVWSISSCFDGDFIKDELLRKFPVAIVPERYMLSKDVPGLIRVSLWIFFVFPPGLQNQKHFTKSLRRPIMTIKLWGILLRGISWPPWKKKLSVHFLGVDFLFGIHNLSK